MLADPQGAPTYSLRRLFVQSLDVDDRKAARHQRAKDLARARRALGTIKHRLRLGLELVDVLTPTTLSPVQAQILARLGLMTPDVYLHPSITPHPP